MSIPEEMPEIENSLQRLGNVVGSVEDLSEELEYFGFSQLPSVEPDTVNLAAKPLVVLLASLVSVAWEILQRYRVAGSKHEDVETHHHTLSNENKCLQAQIQQLKTELSKKGKTVDHASVESKSLKFKFEKLQMELKKVKEEVTILKGKLARQECQHTHTVRRKDNEIEYLQNQLQQRAVQNSPWKPRSPPLLSVEQEELYKSIISKFESNNVLLIQENVLLREAFYKLHTDLGLVTWEFKDLMGPQLGVNFLEVLPW
ncbi:uncharacterized protein LOC134533885 isoform X2 [Bacillus rossius redtenbacheri]|uniref:uncharacterized protein LOC134533885 isoform X2 n=1 Tax=Bacillus rossius redtenbacheri TaxID=93214 RepID=UPI002FDD8295